MVKAVSLSSLLCHTVPFLPLCLSTSWLQNGLFSQAPTPQQREMMEEASARIAQDNCELACCFIQKTAVEKAGPEMDKRLATVRH